MIQEHTAIEVMPELLPCPFCGGEAEVGSAIIGGVAVLCQDGDCFCSGPICESEAEAIAVWNTRAQPSITPAAGGLVEVVQEVGCRLRQTGLLTDQRLAERLECAALSTAIPPSEPQPPVCSVCNGWRVIGEPGTYDVAKPGLPCPECTPTTEPQSASPSGLVAMAKGTEPTACHVLGGRFDNDVGEWHFDVVATPLTFPFTHWWPLPDLAAALAAPATADDATPPEQPASNTVRDLKSWAEMQDDNAEIVACGERWKVIAAGVGMTVHGYDSDYRASFYNPDGGVVEVGPKLRAIFAALSPPPAGQTGVDEGQHTEAMALLREAQDSIEFCSGSCDSSLIAPHRQPSREC